MVFKAPLKPFQRGFSWTGYGSAAGVFFYGARPTFWDFQVDKWDVSKLSFLLLVDEILHQLRLVIYPIIYRVLYIPGGAGFLPSTVSYFFR